MARFADDLLGRMLQSRIEALLLERIPVAAPRRSLVSTVMEGIHKTVRLVPLLPCPQFVLRMSFSEKMFASGFAVLATAKVYEMGLFGLTLRTVSSVFPRFEWLRSCITGGRLVYDPARFSRRNVLESRRTGSEEYSMTQPKFQCVVAVQEGNDKVALGCAVRFGDDRFKYLVGPDHVLGGQEEKFVKGSQSWLSLKNHERIILAADLVAVKLTDKEMSVIGIASGKIGYVSSKGERAQIVGAQGKGTTGTVLNETRYFGSVIYDGTTVGGYSGAAYYAGNIIYGLHQAGGVVNGGVAAGFVWNLICLHENYKTESSEDWLLGQYKHSKRIHWRQFGDPAYVQVEVNGQYAIVERDSMANAFGSDWEQDEFIESGIDYERSYRDFESLAANFVSNSQAGSGEVSNSTSSGASSLSVEPRAQGVQPVQELIDAYNKLSSRHRKRFLQLSQLQIGQTKPMVGQAKAT